MNRTNLKCLNRYVLMFMSLTLLAACSNHKKVNDSQHQKITFPGYKIAKDTSTDQLKVVPTSSPTTTPTTTPMSQHTPMANKPTEIPQESLPENFTQNSAQVSPQKSKTDVADKSIPSEENMSDKKLQPPCGTEVECDLIQKTNLARLQYSISALGLFNPCMLMAQEQVRYMAKTGIYDHERPDETFYERSKRFGCIGGENIVYGTKTVDETITIWMNSPSHRKNMLNPRFLSIGVGYYQGYWAQCFSYIEGDADADAK